MYSDHFLGIYCLKIIMWHLIGFAVCTVGLPSLPLSVSFGAPHPTSLSSLVVCCWGCAMPSASCESKFNTCKYSKQSINQKLKTICTCQSVHTHTLKHARTHTLLLIFTVTNRPSAFQQPTGSRRSPTFTYDYLFDFAVRMLLYTRLFPRMSVLHLIDHKLSVLQLYYLLYVRLFQFEFSLINL